MKIYNKVVIAWNKATQRYDKTVYEDSFEYDGELYLAQTRDPDPPGDDECAWCCLDTQANNYGWCEGLDSCCDGANCQGTNGCIEPTFDHECCTYAPPDPIYGCMDQLACNYNPAADWSTECIYADHGCECSDSVPEGIECDDGSWVCNDINECLEDRDDGICYITLFDYFIVEC